MEIALKAIGLVLLILAFRRINVWLHALLDFLFDYELFKDLKE